MGDEITAWIVGATFHKQALTEISRVGNHFTRTGFVLTLNDKDGNPHELRTSTFDLLSAQDADEVRTLSTGLAESALGRPAEITASTSAEWLKTR